MKAIKLPLFVLVLTMTSPLYAEEAQLGWHAFGNAVKQECAEFGETVDNSKSELFRPSKRRLPPRYPNGEPPLPYACVWLSYDVTEKGRTENVEVIFKSPADLGSGFEQAAKRAVKRWRYKAIDEESFSGISDMAAQITFETPM